MSDDWTSRRTESSEGDPYTDPSTGALHRRVLTGRLELRETDPDGDLDALFAIFSDPSGWWYDPAGRHTDRGQTRAWLARAAARFESDGLSYWTVRRRDDGAVIGVGGAQRQRTRAWNLNYRIAASQQGQGFATELARAAYAAASAVDPDVPFIAWVAPENAPSRRVAERLGLTSYGLRADPSDGRERLAFADRPLDDWSVTMRALARDWLFGDLPDGTRLGSLVLPLENPDLHDPEPFLRRLGPHEPYRSVALAPGRGVLRPKFGAPAVALTVEVAAGLGAERIVGVGFCGGLRAELECGHVMIVEAALDERSGRRAEASLPLPGGARGLVVSTDAPLEETSAKVAAWARLGALGVDMESFALLDTAARAGVAAAVVLVASDNPLSGSLADPERLAAGLEDAAELAFAALSR
jgi:RimJ/RimL family protein N-acetyltransferase